MYKCHIHCRTEEVRSDHCSAILRTGRKVGRLWGVFPPTWSPCQVCADFQSPPPLRPPLFLDLLDASHWNAWGSGCEQHVIKGGGLDMRVDNTESEDVCFIRSADAESQT